MTLRARVLAGLAVIAVVLVAGGFFVAAANEANLIAQVDDQLRIAAAPTRTATVVPLPNQPQGNQPQGANGQTGAPPVPPAGNGTGATVTGATGEPERLSPLYTGVVNAAGGIDTVFAPNLTGDGVTLPAIDGAQATAMADTGTVFTVGSVEGSTNYRVLAVTDQRTGAVVVVALPLDGVDAAVLRLIAVEAVAIVVALGVLGLVAWWVIRLGVRPVNEMAHAATAIAAGDLSHRVPESDPGTEAGELGRALNQMLCRIEAAFDEQAATEDRLRRFAADASHELRTPITTIRGYAELYRTGGLDDPDALDEAVRRTEEEATRMGTLVEDLLQLARLDQGRPLDRAPVDLAGFVRDAAADASAVQPGRTVIARVDEPTLVVPGDADRLRQVLANLVGNALVHTPTDAPIDLHLARLDDEAMIEVIDHGPGMPPDVAGRAFERFFRADPARARRGANGGGSGLGLAIAHDLVIAHGGRIELDSRLGIGTTVRVVLPAAPSPAADSAGTPRLLAGASQAGS